MLKAKTLGSTSLSDVLSASIKEDSAIHAAALSMDKALFPLVQLIPQSLLWARLWANNGVILSPSLQRLADFCGGLPPLSDTELELLAMQVSVDFWDTSWPRTLRESLVRNSTSWHRIKGTPASLKTALALFGYQAEIEEDGKGPNWATYQLGLPSIADIPTVQKILSIVQEMQPARCRLWRMYTSVWDMRPAIYSGQYGYSESFYSFYSGIPVPDPNNPDSDVLVSFGKKWPVFLPCNTVQVFWGVSRLRGSLTFRQDAMLYSAAFYSSMPTRNHGFSRYRLRQIAYPQKPTYFIFARRSLSCIQAQYGASLYGESNSRYTRPSVLVLGSPSVYGETVYSGEKAQFKRIYLDEMFFHSSLHQSEPRTYGMPQYAHVRHGTTHRAISTPALPPHPTWQGRWDSRTWAAFGPQTHLTHSADA